MARSMDDIFQHMRQRAASRPSHAEGHDDTAPCQCGGRLYYVKSTLQGRLYEVCPRCNPRTGCSECGGTGHLRQPGSHAGEDSLIPFGCDCVVTEQRVQLLNSAQIPEKYMLAAFSIDNLQHGHEALSAEAAARHTRNQAQVIGFCNAAPSIIQNGPQAGDRYFLTLLGPVGTGKTHLAVCALKHLIWTHGFSGRFIDFQSLLQEIKDSYSKKDKANATEEDLKRPLRQVEVLVIDELGKGRSESEWELEKLDDLINSRYNNGRITILTTNYLPPELQGTQEKSPLLRKETEKGNQFRFMHETLADDMKGSHPTESYRAMSLPDRIGERMYDRIVEASLFVDFSGIPSFRRRLADDFLKRMERGG